MPQQMCICGMIHITISIHTVVSRWHTIKNIKKCIFKNAFKTKVKHYKIDPHGQVPFIQLGKPARKKMFSVVSWKRRQRAHSIFWQECYSTEQGQLHWRPCSQLLQRELLGSLQLARETLLQATMIYRVYSTGTYSQCSETCTGCLYTLELPSSWGQTTALPVELTALTENFFIPLKPSFMVFSNYLFCLLSLVIEIV